MSEMVVFGEHVSGANSRATVALLCYRSIDEGSGTERVRHDVPLDFRAIIIDHSPLRPSKNPSFVARFDLCDKLFAHCVISPPFVTM